MDENNQNTGAPQFPGTNFSPQPKPKSTKTLVVLVGFVLIAGLVFWALKRNGGDVQTIQALSESSIKNTVYFDGTIKLVDGYYAGKDETGKISDDYYTKIDSIYQGDVDGDSTNDAVVILSSRSGGTGVGRDVAFVLNKGGNATAVDTFPINDDRPEIKSVKIENGVVSITYAPWNGGNPINKTIQLKLSGSKIEQLKSGNDSSSVNSSWKTYTNLGFQIEHPSNWSVVEYPSNSSEVRKEKLINLYGPNADLSSINIKYYDNLSALPLNPTTDKPYEYFDQYVMDTRLFINQKIISLDSGTAKSATLVQDPSYKILLVGGNGHFYEISYKARYNQTLTELDKIVSTFKFTK